MVRGAAGERPLDPSFRSDEPWPREHKVALVERGYHLTDEALRAERATLDGAPAP